MKPGLPPVGTASRATRPAAMVCHSSPAAPALQPEARRTIHPATRVDWTQDGERGPACAATLRGAASRLAAWYVFSVALFSSPSPPLREERAGERRLP